VTISGSLDLFSNEFFEAAVQKYSADGNTPRFEKSGNAEFARHLTSWTFNQRGVIRIVDASYRKVETDTSSTSPGFRIKDKLEFTATLREWNGAEWTPFSSDDVQLEFVRLDPHVRTTLVHDDKGVYGTTFVIPDVYGVFTVRLTHNRLGYTFVDWRSTLSVRPYRHDEYERFIVAAYPYYASAFSMMIGFGLFSMFFLYHENSRKAEK